LTPRIRFIIDKLQDMPRNMGKVNMNQFPRFLACCVALIVWVTPSFASDFLSPRSAALGGAGHAGPMLNDAIYMNPSFVSFLPSYSISGNYLFFHGPSVDTEGPGDPHGHGFNVSLQDGRSELFQAGVGFTQMEDRRVVNIGASKSIIPKFGVGVGGKFVVPNSDSSPHPIYDSLLSVTGVPLEWLQVAGIIDNLIESDQSRANGLYREYILGTKANIKGIVLAYFDPHWAPHAQDVFGHELGLEFPILQDLFLRVGNFRNANLPYLNYLRGRGYSVGFGWIGPRMSFDYAFSRVLEPVNATLHNMGATIYF
jgi:hypothetical protein